VNSPTSSTTRSTHGFALFLAASLLVLLFLLRLTLWISFKPVEWAASWQIPVAFLIGLHLDIFVVAVVLLPLFIYWACLPQKWFAAGWQRLLFFLFFLVFWVVQIFLLMAEYFFFDEFKSRFNTVAVDYLIYPQEVFINIWDSYPVVPVILVCAGLSLAWCVIAFRRYRSMWSNPLPRSRRWLAVGLNLGVCLALLPTISLKEHRFSSERTLNEIANNGTLAFLAAAWTHNLDYGAFYKTMPLDEAYQRTRPLLTEPKSQLTDPGRSIRRKVEGDPQRPRLNVVIVLEESLGASFWGVMGRKEASLTPEMDRLANAEGILFTNIFASGNRTVRGMEGVLSSFPPLPGESIVKRPLSHNVESIARVLKRDGYATLFLYGGRGLFDGMRSYALDNGYDRFIEQKDFENPVFATIWGVCDEELFNRTIKECRALHEQGKPFQATLLTVSNHKPYTYPKGRIPEDPDQRKEEHAVKYADYALGQFFQAAKKEPFYTNTIFVVIADHGARVYGSQNIPIHSYEIPWLVVGPAVVKKPMHLGPLGCSLDVSPTVLGLIGRPYETLFFGRDLLNSPADGNRALIHHNRDIGIFRHERLVTLGLRKTANYYEGNPKIKDLVSMPQPDALALEAEKDAIAIFQVADDLYMTERYHLDP
jgi:phosphoglycerol transferase MdoB-like AlkP superfamily enzyme